MSSAQNDSAASGKIAFYRFQKDPARFCTSRYVNKLDALLTFSGIKDIEYRPGNPLAAPRGTLPFIEVNGATIPDSELAYNTCIEKGLVECLDRKAGLNDKESATSFALRALVEQLGEMMVYERWIENWYLTRDKFLVVIPAIIRPPLAYMVAYRKVDNRMRSTGFALLTPEERDKDLRDKIKAMATFIPKSGYILGKPTPTRIDAIVFGYITGISYTPDLNPKAATELHKYPQAESYRSRLAVEFWPNRKPLN